MIRPLPRWRHFITAAVLVSFGGCAPAPEQPEFFDVPRLIDSDKPIRVITQADLAKLPRIITEVQVRNHFGPPVPSDLPLYHYPSETSVAQLKSIPASKDLFAAYDDASEIILTSGYWFLFYWDSNDLNQSELLKVVTRTSEGDGYEVLWPPDRTGQIYLDDDEGAQLFESYNQRVEASGR